MKKIMIFAAVAAMFMFSSCQKEEVQPGQNSKSEELVFTAIIDQNSTKTTINTTDGKIEWVEGDEITITDAESTSVVYVAESSGASVSFKKKEGETGSLASGSTYSATYKAAPATAQAYTDYYSAANTAKDLYMMASSTSGTTLTFKAACGLLKLNLTASGENTKDISKIEIVGTPTGGSAAVYTLTCDNESIESAKDFYVALPAGSYTLMKFTNSKGCVCFKKATKAMEIAANDLQPITLSGITFSAVLPGKFTVASGKQVQFTTANLYWDSSAFKFEASQTDYDKGTYYDETMATYTSTHVSHFYWTKTTAASYAETFNDGTTTTSDKFFADGSDADHSLTIGGQSGLYALSKDEWTYLLSSTGRGDGDSKFKFPVTVNGNANCLVIAPDGYSGTAIADSYDAAAWATAESTGLVCLPAGGLRGGSYLAYFSTGYYLSSTSYEGTLYDDAHGAYSMQFGYNQDTPEVRTSGYTFRYLGMSVRLVYSEAPSVLLPGEFSVSATKKVKFTKGNLWWNGSAFKLESSQTDYDEGTYNEQEETTIYTSSHVSHFFWTKDAANSYAEAYDDGELTKEDVPFFAESKGGLTVEGQSGLYALSSAEWTYLIDSRTSGLYKYGVTVTNGGTSYTNCLIIAPDDFTGTLASSYTLDEVNASGLVCLPAAGYRDGSILDGCDFSGDYWSATPLGYIEDIGYSAYSQYFDGDGFFQAEGYRNYGISVRLVCEVSAE